MTVMAGSKATGLELELKTYIWFTSSRHIEKEFTRNGMSFWNIKSSLFPSGTPLPTSFPNNSINQWPSIQIYKLMEKILNPISICIYWVLTFFFISLFYPSPLKLLTQIPCIPFELLNLITRINSYLYFQFVSLPYYFSLSGLTLSMFVCKIVILDLWW